MIRLLLAISLFGAFAHAEETTATAPEVSASIDTVAPSSEFKRNELLLSSSSAQFNGSYSAQSANRYFDFGMGYNRALTSFLQIGGLVNYRYSSYENYFGTKRSSNFSLRLGPTFNFGTSRGLENAFFLGLSVERSFSSFEDSDSDYSIYMYQATLGKRFKLFENVAFTPHAYVNMYSSSSTYYYGVQLLSASVLC